MFAVIVFCFGFWIVLIMAIWGFPMLIAWARVVWHLILICCQILLFIYEFIAVMFITINALFRKWTRPQWEARWDRIFMRCDKGRDFINKVRPNEGGDDDEEEDNDEIFYLWRMLSHKK